MGRGVNNSGVIDCNQTHSSFLIYILSTFFNFLKKPILTKAPAESNVVDYILKNDRSNLLPLGQSETGYHVATGGETCRVEQNGKKGGRPEYGRAQSKAGGARGRHLCWPYAPDAAMWWRLHWRFQFPIAPLSLSVSQRISCHPSEPASSGMSFLRRQREVLGGLGHVAYAHKHPCIYTRVCAHGMSSWQNVYT